MTPSLTNAGKPDDVSQEAWQAGQSVLMESRLFMIATDDFDEHSALIARAILAAEKRGEEREREACAQVVATFELEADDAAPEDYRDGYEAAVSEFSVFSAAAIRKRGGE